MLQEHSDWQIICEASDGFEAVQKTEELQPDLILLDVGLPNLNGIEAARQICAIAPRSKVLFFSEILCSEVVQEALCIGAHGYVLKSDTAHDLLPAVEAVIEGKRFVSSRFGSCDPAGPQGNDSHDTLFIAGSRSARQIARSMTESQAREAAQERLKKLVEMDVAAILLGYGVERKEARRIAFNAANDAQQSAGMLRMVKFRSPGVK
jgi:DNA-binding NarL/FixJ family response regulator